MHSTYRMTFGRKFYAGIVCLLLISSIFGTTLAYRPEAITPWVVITFGTFLITVCFMYIGGNVFNKWIRSKYFKPEIFNSAQK